MSDTFTLDQLEAAFIYAGVSQQRRADMKWFLADLARRRAPVATDVGTNGYRPIWGQEPASPPAAPPVRQGEATGKTSPGIGMPASLYLQDFGQIVRDAFGEIPYHVGSSMAGSGKPSWRDVDVRLLLRDERYEADGYGDPDRTHDNPKWVAITKAFSLLGQQMTGLPIDFQIQQLSHANRLFGSDKPEHHRSALFSLARARKPELPTQPPPPVNGCCRSGYLCAHEPSDCECCPCGGDSMRFSGPMCEACEAAGCGENYAAAECNVVAKARILGAVEAAKPRVDQFKPHKDSRALMNEPLDAKAPPVNGPAHPPAEPAKGTLGQRIRAAASCYPGPVAPTWQDQLKMADEADALEARLATAEKERDEARRWRASETANRDATIERLSRELSEVHSRVVTRDARIKSLEDSAAEDSRRMAAPLEQDEYRIAQNAALVARANAAEHDAEIWKARAEARK